METTKIQTLQEMTAGQNGTVLALPADRVARERVVRMGIRVGCELKMLLNHSGRCLVGIHDTRIAVNHDTAQDIALMVKEGDDAFAQAVSRLKQIWAH